MGVVIITTIFLALAAKLLHIIFSNSIVIKVPKRSGGFTYFRPQKAVNWFDFYGLYKSFLKIADSGKTLEIIDKREVISTFKNDDFDRIKLKEHESEKWIDFLADTGDGFDSTTTLFYYLTRKNLPYHNMTLNRGQVCIVGGDLVYPDASEEEYNNRFKGPIRLVLPYDSSSFETDSQKPILLATPGNHDWYDGCSAFIRMMCQQKSIGGFSTIQHRTYFAYAITSNLHLLGIDNQLLGDIDIPQLDYFKNYVRLLSKDRKQNVLLFVAEPYWYNYSFDERMQYRQRMDSLEYLIQELKGSNREVTIKAIITGDIHHYARYESNKMDTAFSDNPMLITSGGGGAFKHMTHKLEDKITIPNFECPSSTSNSKSVLYNLITRYPDEKWSRCHLWKNIRFAFSNLSFTLTLGILLWGVLAISGWHPFPVRVTQYISGILVLPFVYFALLSAVESKETSVKSKKQFYIEIFFFTLIGIAFNSMLLVKLIPISALVIDEQHYIREMLFVGLKCLFFAILNNTLFGIFLIIRFQLFRKNHTEASSSNVEQGYNNFVRMQISKEKINFYVIGIEKVLPFRKHTHKNRNLFNEGKGTFDVDLKSIFPDNKSSYKIIEKFDIKLD